MAKQTGKQGRVPSSQRESDSEMDSEFDDFSDLDFNLLQLDDSIRKELKDKGLVPRWINATKFMQGGNFHRSGWRAYRRETTGEKGAAEFNYGTSPEGYIVRNDLMLAVKTARDNARWRKKLDHETAIRSGADSSRAAELRQAAREAGVSGIKIHDGYDANGDSDAGDE